MKSVQFATRAISALVFIALSELSSASASDADKIANIHTIGIVSAIGHEAALQNVGIMVFTNGLEKVPIDDWGLDDAVIADATSLLSGRVTVRPVQYDRVTFATEKRGFIGAAHIPVEDLVAGLTDREGIDAFLVIHIAELDDPVANTNQTVGGLGLYRHPLGFKHTIAAYALYAIELVDARTNKTIKGVVPRTGDSGFMDPKFPIARGCSETLWPENAAAMTDAQRQALKQTVSGLVSISLPWGLYELGLLGAMPSEAEPTCVSP